VAAEDAPRPCRGAHSQFKEALSEDLHKRLVATVRQRAGPSFDERMQKALKEMKTKARAAEAEQRKNLSACVERGRSRPATAPVRPQSESPNQAAMLRQRVQTMRKARAGYSSQLDAMKGRMDRREPLFRVSDVTAAFEMQKRRQAERRQQLTDEENARWEQLRTMEENAANRPLLIENPTYRRPLAVNQSKSTSELPAPGHSWPPSALDRSDLDVDKRILRSVSTKSFRESSWGQTVKHIQEKTDNRQKLHEATYPPKKGVHPFTGHRLMYNVATKRRPLAA